MHKQRYPPRLTTQHYAWFTFDHIIYFTCYRAMKKKNMIEIKFKTTKALFPHKIIDVGAIER